MGGGTCVLIMPTEKPEKQSHYYFISSVNLLQNSPRRSLAPNLRTEPANGSKGPEPLPPP